MSTASAQFPLLRTSAAPPSAARTWSISGSSKPLARITPPRRQTRRRSAASAAMASGLMLATTISAAASLTASAEPMKPMPAISTATSVHIDGPGRFYLAGPNADFVDPSLLSLYLQEMVKMSPLQGTFFEIVPTSHDLALIGAAITSRG